MKFFKAVLGVGLFFLVQCSIQEPVMPRWVVPIEVPLSPERVVMQEELVNDSTIVAHGDSLFIEISGDIDPITVTGENLTFPGQDSTTSFSLDSLSMDSLNNITTGDINIVEILPYLPGMVGQYVFMPETTLTRNPKLVESDEFHAVKVESGEIELIFHNNLPFTLGPNIYSPNGIEIKILSDSTNEQIADVFINQIIPPGGIGIGSSPIQNSSKWVYSPLRLEYYLPIARDTTVLVTDSLLNAAGYRLDIKLRNLTVSEIIGKVEPQFFSDTWNVAIEQEDKIIEARIKQGQLHLKFNNQIAVGATLVFTLPDFLTAAGSPYQDSIYIAPGNVSTKTIVLDGMSALNHQSPGQPLDSLTLIFDVETKESNGFVHVKVGDEIDASIQTTDITFSYFKGILAQDTLHLDPFEEHDIANYEDIPQGFYFHNVALRFDLNNQINIDSMMLNLSLTGYHRNDAGIITDSASIDVDNQNIGLDGSNIILLDGPEVSDFLNIFPTDIRGEGQVVYSGVATVSIGDEIGGHYLFSTPLKITVENPEPIRFDPDTLNKDDIDQSIRDAVGEDIQRALFVGKVSNHLPFGGTLKLFVSTNMTREDLYDTTAFNPDSEFVKTIHLKPGVVDPNTGFVSQISENEISLELSKKELLLFKQYPLRVGFLMEFQNTNGAVWVSGNDYLEVSGKFRFDILVQDKD